MRPLERPIVPFRSMAGALLFCVVLGPVGLLYSSFAGGTLMIVLGVFVLRAKLFVLLGLLWLISCIWGVAAAERYNQQLAERRK